jgi:hypothetical protein
MNTLVMSKNTLPFVIGEYIGKDENGDNVFDFEKIIPIGDVPHLYEKRLERWGTKWPGYNVCISDSTIDFLTAWSPPIPVIEKLAELHKDLVFTLEYAEPGMMFRGVAIARWQGDTVLLEDRHWDMTEKDLKELGLL